MNIFKCDYTGELVEDETDVSIIIVRDETDPRTNDVEHRHVITDVSWSTVIDEIIVIDNSIHAVVIEGLFVSVDDVDDELFDAVETIYDSG